MEALIFLYVSLESLGHDITLDAEILYDFM